MNFVAWKMLTGDRAKYLGLIFTIAFCTFLLENQTSIFAGILRRTGSQIKDVTDAEVWVMDPQTEYFEQTKALKDTDLTRVRSVPGVAWAVRLFKGSPVARTLSGKFAVSEVFGLDDATLSGAPRKMLLGSWERLREPDSVVIDQAGYVLLFPGEPLDLGRIRSLLERAYHPHPLQRGGELSRPRAHPALLRHRQGPGGNDARRARRAHLECHGPPRADHGSVHVGLHPLLPAEHRHPGQLRHHHRRGHRGGGGGRGPDLLSLHRGEPEAVRRPQGHGRDEPEARRHDPAAGRERRRARVRNRHGHGGHVLRDLPPQAGDARHRPDMAIRGSHRRLHSLRGNSGQHPQHPASAGARAGRGLPGVSTMATTDLAVSCHEVRKHFGEGET